MYAFIRFYRFTFFAAAGAVLVSATLAMGQSDYRTETITPGPVHPPVVPYPVEFGFSQHHSSTAFEGAARGQAALIQAHGNHKLAHAQAQILHQQARWIDRVNDLEQTRALHTQQQMWQDHKAAARKAREEITAAGQLKLAERRRTLYRGTYELAEDQLDVATGAINWPSLLASERFAAERVGLEELVRRHFTYGEPDAANADEITDRVIDLERKLRRHRSEFDRVEYQTAQRFLIGLRYEAGALGEQG